LKRSFLIFASFIIPYVLSGMIGQQGKCSEDCPLVVTDWSPRGIIEDVHPTITATIKSLCGAKVSLSSVEMFFDGSSVSPVVSQDNSGVTVIYIPGSNIPDMKTYEVTLRARDEEGNLSEKTWNFHVPFFY